LKIKIILFLSIIFINSCFRDVDDAIMYHIYQSFHGHIQYATWGTEIPPEYLAALISLESYPPGNWDSERFEQKVYERLLKLKQNGTPFNSIPREKIISLTESELRQLATSYGLTQIMGYHCLELGCSIEDLRSSDHLLWSVAYIRRHYLKYIKQKQWEICFKMHNTGNPFGKTHNKDYVEKGLKRMEYYRKWIRLKGNLIANLYEN
jgi:hypothetical protein